MTKAAILYKGEMTFSSTDGAGKTEQLHVKNEIRTFFNIITKISSKWINNLNVRLDIVTLIEGKHRQNTLCHKSQHYLCQSISQSNGNKNK